MVELPDDLGEPGFGIPKIHGEPFAVQGRSAESGLNDEIVPVETFAHAADVSQSVGGGEILFYCDLIHAGFIYRKGGNVNWEGRRAIGRADAGPLTPGT